MSGKTPTKINVDEDTQIDVRCQIHQLSFSPHTDAKGIMDLVKFLYPKHVILVHGEKPKMASLKEKIQLELGIPCYDPANNDTVSIPSTRYVKADASGIFIRSSLSPNFKFLTTNSRENPDFDFTDVKARSLLQVCDDRVGEGILTMERGKKAKVVHQDEFLVMLEGKKHEVQFAQCCPIDIRTLKTDESNGFSSGEYVSPICDKVSWLHALLAKLSSELTDMSIQDCGEHLQVESFRASVCLKDTCPYRTTDRSYDELELVSFCCTWSVGDEKLAWKIISIIKNLQPSAT